MAELASHQVWRRSSRCDTSCCVEVAFDPRQDRVYLRNSRQPSACLEFRAESWRAFCSAVAAGALDYPPSGGR